MDTRYIYAGTRARTLGYELLSETQEERLLGAKSTEEAFKVLQDTFIAPLLTKHEKSDIEKTYGKALALSKNLLTSIAPDPELLDILWLKYDFFNITALIKSKKRNLPYDEAVSNCSSLGKYPRATLKNAFDNGKLGNINLHFKNAVDAAEKVNHIFEKGIAINRYYFKAIQAIDFSHPRNAFIHNYVILLIDLYNLTTALRIMKLADTGIKPRDVFVSGGTFKESDLDGEKKVLEQFARIGGEKYWAEQIKDYIETGNFSLVEKARDEYIMDFLKNASTDIFSPASLFAYFAASKNSVQIIKSIMVAKKSGMKERDLRFILRRLYA